VCPVPLIPRPSPSSLALVLVLGSSRAIPSLLAGSWQIKSVGHFSLGHSSQGIQQAPLEAETKGVQLFKCSKRKHGGGCALRAGKGSSKTPTPKNIGGPAVGR
jgi:hypothetical protein